MANQASNTDFDRWNSALGNHAVARTAWQAIEDAEDCSARQQVALALEDAENVVQTALAPDLSGVVRKLELHWERTLDEDSFEGSLKRKVIGDLRRIERQLAGVEEVDASGQSPEEAELLAAEWRTALAEHDEHEKLLVEGPSLRWGGRRAIDIVDAIDHAAGLILSHPAPNLHGVIRKLELLWEDDRYDPIEGAVCVHILRDLHRLSRTTSEPRWPH